MGLLLLINRYKTYNGQLINKRQVIIEQPLQEGQKRIQVAKRRHPQRVQMFLQDANNRLRGMFWSWLALKFYRFDSVLGQS